MNKLIQRNINRPALAHQPTLVLNKKNKPINNKPMNHKNNLAKDPTLHCPSKFVNNIAKITVEDRQDENKSEEQTRSTEEDEDCLLFIQPLPCQRFNQQLRDYKQEILQYVKKREETFAVDATYLRSHKVLTVKMRRYLVRHLFKIYRKFQLLRSTLHLAVHYMDLYFSRKNQFKDQLETVSIAQACLFIAMKYQQIYPPELSDWIDRRYRYQIFKLEAQILKTLDFQLGHYTLENFMTFYMWEIEDNQRETVQDQANQMLLLMDLTLFDLNLRQFKYSELAKCIYGLTHNIAEDKFDVNMVQNLKWMIDRNQQSIEWLIQQKYRKAVLPHLS